MKRGLAYNPFCVQELGPLGIDYQFNDEAEREKFFGLLESNGWWMELCGPHGIGKSTLLTTIQREAESCGKTVVRFKVRAESRWLPFRWKRELKNADFCLLDGGEAAIGWQRALLAHHCRSHQIGFVFTTHHPLGIAPVYTMSTTPGQIRQAVAKLLGNDHHWLFEIDFEKLVSEFNGDNRELMFTLYDWYEEGEIPTQFCRSRTFV